MTPRLKLAFAVLASSAFSLGCAQTHVPVSKAQAKGPEPSVAKLQPFVPNPKWTVGQNSAQLLLDIHVQKSLELSTEAKSAVMKVYSDFNVKYTELTKNVTDRDALDAAMDAATLEAANKAVSKLSATQVTRLNQLGVQAMELEAFRLADVRSKLGLTPDQVSQFDKTLTELDTKQAAFDTELGERMGKFPDPGPAATTEQLAALRKQQSGVLEDMRPQAVALEDLRKADLTAFVAVLTSEQKATWQSMLGTPFNG